MKRQFPESHDPFFRLRIDEGGIVHQGDPFCYRTLQAAPPASDVPFFRWNWDGQTLSIENDRYGFYPLFYCQHKNEFLISPSLLTLLQNGAPSEIDWSALAVFLRLGNYVGMDTPFRHIRLVPPNARVERAGDGFRVLGGRPKIAPDWNLSGEAARDGYIDLFREAIARMPVKERAVVPLSGGRDSRHIFLELHRQNVLPLSALSILYGGYVQTDDVAVAQELASAAAKPHVTIRVPKEVVRLERGKNLSTHMCTLEHGWVLAALGYIAGQRATVYEGVAGDTLSTAWGLSPTRLKLLNQGDLQGLAETYLSEGYLPNALTPQALKNCTRELAQHRLVEELRNHLDAANPLGSFHFWNRTRRVTGLAPCCIWRQTGPVWCPYLDHRLFDFLSSIPAALLIDKEYSRFHTDVILRAYPEFAHIPFADKYSKRRPARSFHWAAARQMARHELQRSSRTLLRTSFAAPRIVRALVDPSYTSTASSLLPLYVYLRQLEGYMA